MKKNIFILDGKDKRWYNKIKTKKFIQCDRRTIRQQSSAGQSGNNQAPDNPATIKRRTIRQGGNMNKIVETNVAETNVAETNVAETNVAETNVAETNVAETNVAEVIDNSAIRVLMAKGERELNTKRNTTIYSLIVASFATQQSSKVYMERLLTFSGMYTCDEFSEFMKKNNIITPAFLSKSVDRIWRDIKNGKYKIVELPDNNNNIAQFYSRIGEADNICRKEVFDALHSLCEALQKRGQRAKKEGKALSEKADELTTIIRNNIGKENKGLFHDSQKLLNETIKEIDLFNNTPAKKAYYSIEIKSVWNEYAGIVWTDSPDFKTRQKSETERILEEQQKVSANVDKPTIADLYMAWKEYRATINPQTETAKSEAQRKSLERLFQLIK